jgi:hypothetical protein
MRGPKKIKSFKTIGVLNNSNEIIKRRKGEKKEKAGARIKEVRQERTLERKKCQASIWNV